MDMQAKIDEIEQRRAARKAALEADRKQQYAQDLEALDALEIEHGDGAVARLDVERFVKGQPTFVVLKAPSRAYYKRFCDRALAAQKRDDVKARQEATDELARSCWIYPAGEEQQKAMLEAFPGLLVSVAARAAKLVEAEAEQSGKG